MVPVLLLVASASIGVDFGWQPVAGGSFEYMIRIDPQMIEFMKQGEPYISDIPPTLRNIQKIRIMVGSDEDGVLIHQNEVPQKAPSGAANPDQTAGSHSSYGPDRTLTVAPRTDDGPRLPGINPGGQVALSEIGDRFAQRASAKITADSERPPNSSRTQARNTNKEVTDRNDSNRKVAEDDAGPNPNRRPGHLDDAGAEPVKPWAPFTAALLGLFASLGFNGFLIWVTMTQRERYRSLLGQLQAT